MTTVFLSGSRGLGRLSEAVRTRIDNIIENCLSVVVGDANGADKAIQAYLAFKTYRDVVVYHVGRHPRNNVGNWTSVAVEVKSTETGADYYAEKDKAMAALADFGLVVWNGKSAGSVHNVLELLKRGKRVVVYYAPEASFHNICSVNELEALLKKANPQEVDAIKRKLGISKSIKELGSKLNQSIEAS